ncbi:MBL fold metallo-hydrolase [uncultured Sunxiuqinia sp.]|uniref:MBL fold metallo-hydrolase n=1 Tax=uncultured Sunxiuqinia sp. TaxID=1573825 RepID=UPI002AA8C9E6|nr:MBL fold metallo-hydrolase [uncultured Sunxiuqinia sp.]
MEKALNFKIEFLGTGTSQGVPVVACDCATCQSTNARDKRLRSALFIEADNQKVVIDAGPDFRQQMLRIGLKKLDAILITHEHTDHIFGLDDIRAFNWVQKHPTDIYAELRVQNSIKRVFDYVFEKNKYPGIPQMNLHLVENKPFKVNSVDVMPIRGYHHKLPVFGFRIGKMAYLTDINRIEDEEKQKLQDLDMLVVNALRIEKHISHFNLKEALELIKEVKPKQAYLTHISHLMGLHENVEQQLPDNVHLAYDGLKLSM